LFGSWISGFTSFIIGAFDIFLAELFLPFTRGVIGLGHEESSCYLLYGFPPLSPCS